MVSEVSWELVFLFIDVQEESKETRLIRMRGECMWTYYETSTDILIWGF